MRNIDLGDYSNKWSEENKMLKADIVAAQYCTYSWKLNR